MKSHPDQPLEREKNCQEVMTATVKRSHLNNDEDKVQGKMPVLLALFHEFLGRLDQCFNEIEHCLKNSSRGLKHGWNH